MSSTPGWQAVRQHGERLQGQPLRTLLPADPDRATRDAVRVDALYASFARQHLDPAAWDALFALARERGVGPALQRLFDGEVVNVSEGRAALHSALRGDAGASGAARAARADALAAHARMDAIEDSLAAAGITDVVHIGIGGSDHGPRLVVDALPSVQRGRPRVHFLANVDGAAVQALLARLDPARTAAVLASKSFGTQEMLLNGGIVRDWLGGTARMHAVTANVERAVAWGIPAERVLPMWDWVGGRFSLWSAVGFVVRLAIGRDGFAALLDGAAAMDRHVRDAAPEDNLALRHALVAVWNRSVLGLPTQAVLPYDERLALLPAYLQQLVMESLGKCVHDDGRGFSGPTGAVVWGGVGSNAQHSFFQALHQGTDVVPCEFIGVARASHPHAANHASLLANLLAQAQALAIGSDCDDPQRRYPGGRPSTVLLLDALTPRSLGQLLAMYEHSVYLQSVLWGINAFDQWGVELGKRLADELLPAVRGDGDAPDDAVTRELLAQLRR